MAFESYGYNPAQSNVTGGSAVGLVQFVLFSGERIKTNCVNFKIVMEVNVRKFIPYCAIFVVVCIVLIGGIYLSMQNVNGNRIKGKVMEKDAHFTIIDMGKAKYHYIIFNKEKKL